MVTTTPKHKLLLILFSVILSLVLLESALRLGGLIVIFFQNRGNQISFTEGQFRILCIGESTTALGGENSYPFQLEEILNKQNPKIKFEVINKGLVSKTSEDILSHLTTYLDQYQPHLVIAMIGINDILLLPRADTWAVKGEETLRHLRIYRLFELLGMHLRHKFNWQAWKTARESPQVSEVPEREWIELNTDAPPEITKAIENFVKFEVVEAQLRSIQGGLQNEPVKNQIKNLLGPLCSRQAWLLVAIGRYHRLRKDYTRAEQALMMSLGKMPLNYGALIELGRCHKEQQQYQKAVSFFQRAYQMDPQGILPLMELRRCYEILHMDKEVYKVSQMLLEKESQDFPIYPEVGDWFKDHKYYDEAEKSFVKAIEQNPNDYSLYEDLAEVYTRLGQEEKADMYYTRAQLKEDRMMEYPPMTVRNYNKIVNDVIARGIKMISMQYPLRSIATLKKIIQPNARVFFVENKKNFEQALQKAQYTEYFSDFFGGDFGHCTRAGNRLIAENLADVISNKILKQ